MTETELWLSAGVLVMLHAGITARNNTMAAVGFISAVLYITVALATIR